MESIWTWVVGILFGFWFVASAIHQLKPKWWLRVSRHDFLSLLPRWSFFAPNPGRSDAHLVFRDTEGGVIGPWQEIVLPISESSIRWLWNPARYPRKAMSDLSNGILQANLLSRDEPRVVLLSPVYIATLEWVMSQTRDSDIPEMRQFALIHSRSFGDERPLSVQFVSEWHRFSL